MTPTSSAPSWTTTPWTTTLLLLQTAAISTVILLAAALAVRCCRRSSAATRHRLWLTAVAVCLATPLVLASLPARIVRVDESPSASPRVAAEVPVVGVEPISQQNDPSTSSMLPHDRVSIEAPTEFAPIGNRAVTVSTPAAPIDKTPSASIEPRQVVSFTERMNKLAASVAASSIPLWCAAVWFLVTAALLARIAVAWLSTQRLIRRSEDASHVDAFSLLAALRADMGIRTPVGLLLSREVDVPTLAGFRRPLILLPPDSANWPRERLSIVLRHELAHVARRDLLTQLLADVTTAVGWFQPLLWHAGRRLRVEREIACDDLVLGAGAAPCDYADELLSVAARVMRPRASLVTVTMAGRSTVEHRIRSILNPHAKRQPLTRKATACITTFAALILITAAYLTPTVAVEPVPRKEDAPEAGTPRIDADAQGEMTFESDETTRTITIHGECFSRDQTPIADMSVKVYRFPARGEEPRIVAETRTDAEGKFVLNDLSTGLLRLRDSETGKFAGHEEWYDITIVSSKAGYATIAKRIDTSEDIDVPVELSFDHADDIGALWGIVKDPRGRPLSGVKVSLPSFSGMRIPEVGNAVTDEQGRFAIRNLIRRDPELSRRWNPKTGEGEVVEFPSSRLEFVFGDNPPTLVGFSGIPKQFNVTLHPPGVIEGRVVDTVTQKPAGGVTVRARGVPGYDFNWQVTTTDAEGRYRLQCARGVYNVSVDAKDRIAPAVAALDIKAGETNRDVNFDLSEGVIISGKILDADGKVSTTGYNGKPLMVAHYGPAFPRIGGAVGATEVATDGTYRLRVSPGKILFYVMGSDASTNLTVNEGTNVRYNFLLGQKEDDELSMQMAQLNAELILRAHEENSAQIVGNTIDEPEPDGAETIERLPDNQEEEPLQEPEVAPEKEPPPTTFNPTENLLKTREAVKRGIDYLLSQQNDDGTWTARENFTIGTTALCTFALLEAGVSQDHEQIVEAFDYLAAQQPDKTYDVATQTLAFCAADPKRFRTLIQRNVDWLQETQLDDGTWSYGTTKIGNGDTSNAEFAIWALDEAAYAGIDIRDETWRKARTYFSEGQLPDGSWGYTPQAGAGSGSMTCAGIASLVICLDHLDDDETEEYKQAALSVERGFKWLSGNFAAGHNPGNPNWLMNYLALLRRVGELTGATIIGENRRSWEDEVNAFLVKHVSPRDGSWTDHQGSVLATAFALLTLKDEGVRAWIFKRQRVRGKVGRVIDEQGQPLKNGPVMITWTLAGHRQDALVARTNDNGEFEFYYPPKFVTYSWQLAVDSDRRGGMNPEVINEHPLVLRVPRVRNSVLGIWKVIPNENKALPQSSQPGTEIFIDNEKMTYWFDLNTSIKMQEEEYRVDAFHTPAHIDIIKVKDSHPGVFKVDHDQLMLCINRKTDERPTDVMPETDTRDYSFLTLQRIDVRRTVAGMFDFKNITPQEERIFAALQELTQIDFNQIPIRDAVRFMGEQHGITFLVDDHGLKEAGIDPELTVTLELSNVTLHEALEMILRPLKLKYKVEGDVVKITVAS